MPRVLLVEDSEMIRNMYAMALKQHGFEVATAGSAGEALARVEEGQYDVILLDMLLSGMSGLDFLTSSDVRAKSPNTKIIALSNMDNPQIIEKARALGVNDYLNKADYEPSQLVAYIDKALSAPPAAQP